MFASETVQAVLTDERLVAGVFRSTSNQTRKVADDDVVMHISFIISQQQQVDEVFPLSMGRDVQRDGLTFVESHHIIRSTDSSDESDVTAGCVRNRPVVF